MAESWVRLWAGTSTDPKWQTIARKSGQPRALVMALFMHLLMVANDAEERGSLDGFSVEDAASAMDCDEEQIVAIVDAMQSRVIEDGRLSGWEKRQPSREDTGNPETGAKSSTQRSREFRERQKSQRDETQCNAMQRDETQCNAPEAEAEAEAEADKSVDIAHASTSSAGDVCVRLRREVKMAEASSAHPKLIALLDAGLTPDEIVAAGREAKAKGKGFAYALAIAEGRRRDAAAVNSLPSARASPRRKTIAEERESVSIALTGRKPNHERQIASTERDITGESSRVA